MGFRLVSLGSKVAYTGERANTIPVVAISSHLAPTSLLWEQVTWLGELLLHCVRVNSVLSHVKSSKTIGPLPWPKNEEYRYTKTPKVGKDTVNYTTNIRISL